MAAGDDGLSETKRVKVAGGTLLFCKHDSQSTSTSMAVNIFLPPGAKLEDKSTLSSVPVLYYLSGLTCTPQNCTEKGGAFAAAAEEGLALVLPDTSPRGVGVVEGDSWDIGTGAGMYVDATEEPWAEHYQMFSYISSELPNLIEKLGLDTSRSSVFGHSMGGHGALLAFLKCPGKFRSVSAFAPICAASKCAWGEKAFTAYLGPDRSKWEEWDATELAKSYHGPSTTILIDQGTADAFLTDEQLNPQLLQTALAPTDPSKPLPLSLKLRFQEGYDHSYYFISTFMPEHIKFHAEKLKDTSALEHAESGEAAT